MILRSIKHFLEFVLGWIVMPKLFLIVISILFAFIGFGLSPETSYTRLLEGVTIGILFFFRKYLALGYLLSYLLGLLA